jgi:hypothetical protein
MTLLTEDEAKTKWCPLARATNLGDLPVSVNRRGNAPDTDCLCIASACMAWRFVPGTGYEPATVGYCGAFGKPA